MTLDLETFNKFRAIIITMGLSPSEAFEEFARNVVNENKFAERILTHYKMLKDKKDIIRFVNNRNMSDVDKEFIYDLLEEKKNGATKIEKEMERRVAEEIEFQKKEQEK